MFMKNYKIMYVLHREEASETFIRREIEGLRGVGVEVLIYTLIPSIKEECGDIAKWHREVWRVLWQRIVARPFSLSYVLRLLRNISPAIHLAATADKLGRPHLHAQFAWCAADAASLAAAALGVKWSCGVHAWDIFTRPRCESRARLATAAGVTACTMKAVGYVQRAAVPHEKVVLVRHGLEPEAYPFNKERSGGHIVAVGRFVRKKGFDTLVRACAILHERGVDFRCTMVGDGPEALRLRHLAERLGVSAVFSWSGWLESQAVVRVVSGATVLALPSRRLGNADSDGFANVLSEAMFLGTAVVTTEAGAAGELLHENENARLVNPDDPAALAQALQELIMEAATRQRLVYAARTTAERHLDQRREIGRLVDFFGRFNR
jgi:glycosyltransferase involved in cell wall biosynthesis